MLNRGTISCRTSHLLTKRSTTLLSIWFRMRMDLCTSQPVPAFSNSTERTGTSFLPEGRYTPSKQGRMEHYIGVVLMALAICDPVPTGQWWHGSIRRAPTEI